MLKHLVIQRRKQLDRGERAARMSRGGAEKGINNEFPDMFCLVLQEGKDFVVNFVISAFVLDLNPTFFKKISIANGVFYNFSFA